MFKVTLIAVGNMRTAQYREAAAEYLKRVKPFAKIEVVEVAAAPFKTEGEIQRAKEKEGEQIMGAFQKRGGDIFLLDEGGKEMGSKEFADFLAARTETTTFVIGGTAGFSDGLKKTYSAISLSRLTMPHELARVVFLEQLYRAATMQQKRNKYHY